MSDVTRILSAVEQGDPHAAKELLPLVYEELRRLAAQKMAQESPGQTLQEAKTKLEFDTNFPVNPGIPPPVFQHRPPAWVEFLDKNPYLAAPVFAAVVTLALLILIGVPYHIILGLIHVVIFPPR